IDANTGVISGDVHYNAKAQHTVKITVVNVHDTGFSAQATMRINVTDIDPILVYDFHKDDNSKDSIELDEGESINTNLITDHIKSLDNRLTLQYSIANVPTGISIDKNTGKLSGAPDADTAGFYDVKVTVSDPSKGVNKEVTFKLEIIEVHHITLDERTYREVDFSELDQVNGTDRFKISGHPSWVKLKSRDAGGIQYLEILPPTDAGGTGQSKLYVFRLDRLPPIGAQGASISSANDEVKEITHTLVKLQINNTRGANQAPVADTIPTQDVAVGTTLSLDLDDYIGDPDKDALRYEVNISGVQTELNNTPIDTQPIDTQPGDTHSIGGNLNGGASAFGLATFGANSKFEAHQTNVEQFPAPALGLASFSSGSNLQGQQIAAEAFGSSAYSYSIDANNVLKIKFNKSGKFRVSVTAVEVTEETSKTTTSFDVFAGMPLPNVNITAPTSTNYKSTFGATASTNDSQAKVRYEWTHSSGLSVDSKYGKSPQFTANQAGAQWIQVKIFDADGRVKESAKHTIQVSGSLAVPDQNVREGQAVNFGTSGFFARSSSTSSYSASGLPSGLSINSKTGVISGTLKYNASGTRTATITLRDSSNSSVNDKTTVKFNVTNVDPVSVGNIPPIFREEYYPVTSDSFKKYISIKDSSLKIRYSLSGSPRVPEGLSINSTTGMFSGTFTNRAAGEYTLTVTMTDTSKGFSKSVNMSAKIIDAPGVSVKADSGINRYSPEQWFDSGYDSFGMETPTGGASSWIKLSSPNGSGLQSLTIDPPRSAHRSEPYIFKLYAKDPLGRRIDGKYVKVRVQVSAPDPIVQRNRAPVRNSSVSLVAAGKAGQSIYSKIPATAFTDPDGDPITYSMSSLPEGLSFNSSSRELTGTVKVAGNYTAKLRATDSNGTWREANVAINIEAVANANSKPVYTGAPMSASFRHNAEGKYNIPFSRFSDPDGDTLLFSVKTPRVPGSLYYDATKKQLRGTISNHSSSTTSYNVTLTANDNRGGTLEKVITIYVDPKPSSGGGGDGGGGGGRGVDIPVEVTPIDGTPIGGSPIETFSIATTTAYFNPAEVASATQAVSPTSTGVTRTEDYWFTYNGNNQVVIDGGSFIGDKISIADQG
ncbi:putative Ig domain-containing protein, partial [Pseudoalteromonas sp. SMS1]|uniref:putative Ig domain-containing protein n=1 Tax=Pseudoalteromonas sp. SMS1 TaxID=2908894 RepID=UPI001F3BA710